ncbi:MAG: hypothetical protein HEP71_32300 [Roseivirga sp.]|nr:hypothetical protein [Roseivirga sp.]
MMVTDDQLFQIQGFLMSEGVSNVGLQEDLADHFCCVIEQCMEGEDLDFDDAFKLAQQRITPDGAKEIEEDLDYLLTIKKKIMLRKVVYVFGFIGVLNLLLAFSMYISGILNAEVSGLLAMAGILTLAISVLPFSFYQMYQRSAQRVREA